MIGRLVGRCYLGNQRAQIEVETSVEGALGGVTVDGRKDHASDQQNDHHPGGRGQKQPGRKRAAAHQGVIPNGLPSGVDMAGKRLMSEQSTTREARSTARCWRRQQIAKSPDRLDDVDIELLADAADENLDRVRVAIKILIV